jgi:AcrR family transcriptional regulator
VAKDKDLGVRKVPQQLRAKQTVDAIFEAAMQVLERTEKDASVQTIADRAGVSVGSLYQYFPTKESLVASLIDLHLTQRVEDLAKRLDAARALPAEEAAKVLVDGMVAMMKPRLGIERAMMRSFVRLGNLESFTARDGEMTALVEKFLRSLGDQVRPVDPALAAFLVFSTLRSALLLTVLQKPERLDDPAFADELRRLVVGFLKEPGAAKA